VSAGVFFFFFQAEDGIRDLTVTGVQTCALPISPAAPAAQAQARAPAAPRDWAALSRAFWLAVLPPLCGLGLLVGVWSLVAAGSRSEERRVGKECRSRWSPYH